MTRCENCDEKTKRLYEINIRGTKLVCPHCLKKLGFQRNLNAHTIKNKPPIK